MSQELHKDFKEFLQLLIENEVRFLVIGGYAVAWLGRPRNTEDLDIWIDCSQENAEKTVTVLNTFGYSMPELKPELFTRGHGIVRLGNPPWKLELFVDIPGVEFSNCYERRTTWPVGELKVPMISLPDLRKNKKASGRAKDFADLEHFLPDPDQTQ